MAEWLYEAGIGEARAALVDGGVIVAAAIEPDDDGPRVGAILPARLTALIAPGRRGIATLADGGEAILDPLPPGLSVGASIRIEITRSAIPERGRPKRALARPAAPDAAERDGPDLLARIAADGAPVRRLHAHELDLLEQAGWSELIDQATRGEIAFPGGALRLVVTPAMALFDVDGTLDPAALAIAGAAAAGRAIRRMGIAGSIGIDLPTLPGRAARLAAAQALDAVLPQPFERTAVNGFGFLQIIRRRLRSSLPELIAADPAAAAARALLRRIERARPPFAPWPVSQAIRAALSRAWLEEGERRAGRGILLAPPAAIGEDMP